MAYKRAVKPSARERAMHYFRSNQLEKARALYQKICNRDKHDSEAWFLLGNINGRLGNPEEAETCLRHVITTDPGHAKAYYCLGAACREQGRREEATENYRQSLRINPLNAEAHNNLGVILQDLGRLSEAEISYRSALLIKPDYAVAYRNLGLLLRDMGRHIEALPNFEKALQIHPQYTEGHLSMGNLFEDLLEYDKAEKAYLQAQRISPRNADVRCSLARLLESQARYQEAATVLQEALAIQPGLAEANFRLALHKLRHGDLQNGWTGYEWRWKTDHCQSRNFQQPLWDGSPFTGHTLLLHGEQGIGDEIMFASCIPDLLSQGVNIVLECDPRLAPLFQRSFPDIVARGEYQRDDLSWLERHGRIDAQVPVGSLPLYLRPTLDSFPEHAGYLRADAQARRVWAKRYRELGTGPKVGITWRGGNTYKETNRRSIPLVLWAPILGTPGAHFINIQYGVHEEELEASISQTGVPIHRWPNVDPIKDLDDYAAMIAELDLVIAVDNSTVHMAGALNVPVWALLPRVPNWRWMLDTSSSPWYPSVRLFRAPAETTWSWVIAEVATELRRLTDGK